ncbi:MAG: single-stranded DNA-binding protein [Cyanobacteriota bacterium]|nr:single-stranded DNA-binding protein [Cyanobacteriota bacterium]
MARNNQVTLTGNLGRDAEIRQTASGEPYVTLNIGTTDSYKDERSGQWKDLPTVWHSVFAFGRTVAGYAAKFEKGDRVKVQGNLSYQTEKKTIAGEDYYFHNASIIARRIEPAQLPKNLRAALNTAHANSTPAEAGNQPPTSF